MAVGLDPALDLSPVWMLETTRLKKTLDARWPEIERDCCASDVNWT